jgi:hypothetical protein
VAELHGYGLYIWRVYIFIDADAPNGGPGIPGTASGLSTTIFISGASSIIWFNWIWLRISLKNLVFESISGGAKYLIYDGMECERAAPDGRDAVRLGALYA